ncbi:MAG TPA: methylated-DNA--[protein]-cysteine S-methyltransferase [Planctomycetota bacterium]|nr:methylated-DNA--[protein]-cysteine S-methyltransferase [Planctomycetota bacterium]
MKNSDRLRAFQQRDPAYDGVFVVGVVTTGIYCRPSCPSRRAKPENLVFFRSPADAVRDGFRACKRCRPGRPAAPGGVLAACDYIARHLEEPIRLDALARHTGRSPFHLQRLFKRSLGVSPKQYARRLRFGRLAAALRNGRAVAPALHAAGFGSSSRLYERSSTHLGMTPATLARKGAGMNIAYDLLDTPLGKVLIAATPAGICAVEIGDRERVLVAELRSDFPSARIERSPSLLRFAKARLLEFFRGGDPHLPLDIRATAFQARVWESLRAIPSGETRTYKEVAKAIGRARSVRAVARACATNLISLLIPCHRVIGSDGGLRGYRWGIKKKRALLERERISAGARARSAGRG